MVAEYKAEIDKLRERREQILTEVTQSNQAELRNSILEVQ
jgi:hypothetical protein